MRFRIQIIWKLPLIVNKSNISPVGFELLAVHVINSAKTLFTLSS